MTMDGGVFSASIGRAIIVLVLGMFRKRERERVRERERFFSGEDDVVSGRAIRLERGRRLCFFPGMMKKTMTVVLLAAWLLTACGCSSLRFWGAGSSEGTVGGAGMSVPLGKSGSKK
jgi:hypothetical protein